jgi:hypothetical protein
VGVTVGVSTILAEPGTTYNPPSIEVSGFAELTFADSGILIAPVIPLGPIVIIAGDSADTLYGAFASGISDLGKFTPCGFT